MAAVNIYTTKPISHYESSDGKKKEVKVRIVTSEDRANNRKRANPSHCQAMQGVAPSLAPYIDEKLGDGLWKPENTRQHDLFQHKFLGKTRLTRNDAWREETTSRE